LVCRTSEKTDKLKDKDGRAKDCRSPSKPSEVHIMNFLEERIVKDGKVKNTAVGYMPKEKVLGLL
jgi:hypothetical protein